MFTGLVQDLGHLDAREQTADGALLRVSTKLASRVELGDSIAVNGACLTATEVGEDTFTAEVMNQTLELTALGVLEPGAALNLELAARVGDRLGGHIVQGHVDGVAEVVSAVPDGIALRLKATVPEQLARYLIKQGSVTLNGVSLTVASVSGLDEQPAWIEVSLIPETLERTNLGGAEPGTLLNIECDVIARYVERLTRAQAKISERDEDSQPCMPGRQI